MIKNGIQRIDLEWKAQKREWNEKDESRIVWERTKTDDEDLEEFIKEAQAQKAQLHLEYWIDGVDLGLWLNLHFFAKRIIGQEFLSTLSFVYNHRAFDEVKFQYQGLDLRKLLGQAIYSQVAPMSNETNEPSAVTSLRMEKENIELYCAACCGDRLCGYFGIRIYHTATEVIWNLGLGVLKDTIRFDRTQYLEAFREHVNMVNKQLALLDVPLVDLYKMGIPYRTISEKRELLINKYQLNQNNFTRIQLNQIFKEGDADEINTALILAKDWAWDLVQLEKNLDAKYNQLSSTEQNLMSWKIHDNISSFAGLKLENVAVVKKAYLLYAP